MIGKKEFSFLNGLMAIFSILKKKEKNKLTKMYSKHEWELISSPQRVFPVDEKLFHVLQTFIQTFIKIRIFGVNKL